MNSLRTRIFGAVAALGFAAMAAVAPMAAQAKSVTGTQTIYNDVNQLKVQITNSEYISAIAGACYASATTTTLQTDCLNLQSTENTALGNARHLIYTLTGTWPNNPMLTVGQRNEIAYLNNRNNFVVGGHFNESNFVKALDLALEDGVAGVAGAFPHAITVAAICAGIGFTSEARAYCASLEHTSAYEYNIFQDYVTMTEGNL